MIYINVTVNANGRVSSFDHWVCSGFRRPLISGYFKLKVTSLKSGECYWLLVTPDQFSRSDDWILAGFLAFTMLILLSRYIYYVWFKSLDFKQYKLLYFSLHLVFSHLKYWLFRRWLYFLLTTDMLQTNRNSSNWWKNKGVNFTENSPIEIFSKF